MTPVGVGSTRQYIALQSGFYEYDSRNDKWTRLGRETTRECISLQSGVYEYDSRTGESTRLSQGTEGSAENKCAVSSHGGGRMQGEKCDYHSSFNPTSTGTVNEEHVWPKRSISVSFNGKTVLGNRSSDHNERTKSELSNDEGIVKEGGLCSHLRRSRLGDGATTSNNSSQVKKERNPARLQRFKEKFRQRGQKAKQLLDYFEDKDQSESPWDPSLKKNSTVDVRNAGTKSTIPSSSHREGTPADYQKSTALAPPRLMYHVPPAHVYEGLAQLTLTLEEGVAKKRREAQIAAMERRREEQLKELAKFDFGLPGVSNKRL